MTTYKQSGKTVVNGKKKIIYKKEGSAKQYVVYKGKHIGLSKYKKIVNNKLKKTKRMRGGNDDPLSNLFSNLNDASRDISGSLMASSQSVSSDPVSGSQNVSGSMQVSPKTGGKCRKITKCKKIKKGKYSGVRKCRKVCK
jgi:hypothetical protein